MTHTHARTHTLTQVTVTHTDTQWQSLSVTVTLVHSQWVTKSVTVSHWVNDWLWVSHSHSQSVNHSVTHSQSLTQWLTRHRQVHLFSYHYQYQYQLVGNQEWEVQIQLTTYFTNLPMFESILVNFLIVWTDFLKYQAQPLPRNTYAWLGVGSNSVTDFQVQLANSSFTFTAPAWALSRGLPNSAWHRKQEKYRVDSHNSDNTRHMDISVPIYSSFVN